MMDNIPIIQLICTVNEVGNSQALRTEDPGWNPSASKNLFSLNNNLTVYRLPDPTTNFQRYLTFIKTIKVQGYIQLNL